MNGKLILIAAVLALAVAGGWAYKTGALDDLLSSNSSGSSMNDLGDGSKSQRVDGPISEIPGLSARSKGKKIGDEKSFGKQLVTVIRMSNELLGDVFDTVKRGLSCKRTLEIVEDRF